MVVVSNPPGWQGTCSCSIVIVATTPNLSFVRKVCDCLVDAFFSHSRNTNVGAHLGGMSRWGESASFWTRLGWLRHSLIAQDDTSKS